MATTLADAPRRGSRLTPWLRGCAAGILLVIVIIAVDDLFFGNFHAVVPGRVYRSAQPSAAELETILRKYDIRTVVNLRGCCAPMDWYLDECRVTHALNVAQEDISLSAMRLPSTSEIRRLVEVLDHCEYPILFHCYRGADRTGLASAVARLLQEGVTLDEALSELGIVYGHLSIGKTGQIDRFFQLYAGWLAEHGVAHAPALFRRWVADGYCPGECRCAMELLHAPNSVPRGRPVALALRVRNTSIMSWRLRPENNAGIHAAFTLFDSQSGTVAEGRAGLFDAEVAPGESIDLTLALPAVHQPGKYRLVVDMVDEQHCSFFQAGSDVLEWELEVRDQETATGR
jgi:hypothetical protein